ncbi:cytochrome P450 [Mycena metata]|uniref:Cytochrome P450 n=1 Tax=Mycena metata TaxID=1033252 RepID=A0AAD7JHE8_9AGAR|nr:cytochrome P450 [Mycena metata]
MNSKIHIAVLVGIASAIALAILRGRRLLPPSVGKFPLGEKPWKAYAGLAKTLGPVLSVSTFGKTVIILNSAESALEIVDRRVNFACKPRWPMAELLGKQHSVAFVYYGERHKKMRKVLHASLNPTIIVSTWGEHVDMQSISLCSALLKAPDAFFTLIEDNIQRHVIGHVYGRQPTSEYCRIIKDVMDQTSAALQPGRWMVDLWPALLHLPSWIPGAEFKRWAAEARELFLRSMTEPFLATKADVASGNAPFSFVQYALQNVDYISPEDENVLIDAAGTFVTAGTETTVSVLLTFVAMMSRHPDVQEKAFREIQETVGDDRLANLQDRESLPYLECIIKELLRFNPSVPLIPHSNMREDTYQDYRIPQKSWILINVWAVLHDESTYPNPEKFIPERFKQASTPDPRSFVFGLGRRRCPGAAFAELVLYISMVRLLTLFKFTSMDDGQPFDVVPRLVTIPKPFNCRITVRANARALLESHLTR